MKESILNYFFKSHVYAHSLENVCQTFFSPKNNQIHFV